ncbi:uncharacterized protein BJ171DRAFT_566838 [Polychytrium aggregatum]|uniref:uncharacterized protein n=1 Tax=Polychytrium aggregatum TaxID=110093 RepID=UPI0022FDFFC7|nr:uncharacterized protein BJ171DRAFT_566838 [Polychytrium aggregatum]KAI9206526.1 hypothetical protein BJ171DRAFT_566838 [Polychytrium aggregatum]
MDSDAATKTLEMIRRLKDRNGRLVFEIFETLPSRDDYPDYYDVIARPIALDMIESRIKLGGYSSLASFYGDIAVMIENAKTYNRKGSFVYKNAETIQAAIESTSPNALSGADKSQDHGAADIKTLWDQIVRYRAIGGSTGAAFSRLTSVKDSTFSEAARFFEKMSLKARDFGYPTFDSFTADVRSWIAMIKGRTDDEDPLSLANDIELQVEDFVVQRSTPLRPGMTPIPELVSAGTKFKIGDYIYLKPDSATLKAVVAQIYSIWKVGATEKIRICIFLQADDPSIKGIASFMENEVFKTSSYHVVDASRILGKCYVLFLRDYVRGKPPGASASDVFVCESKLNSSSKGLVKIKNWNTCLPEAVRGQEIDLDLYDKALVPTKSHSTPAKLPTQQAAIHPTSGLVGSPAAVAVAPSFYPTPMLPVPTPVLHPPPHINPADSLPARINEKFLCTDDSKLKWFASPPIDVVPTPVLTHSLAYLVKKRKDRLKAEQDREDQATIAAASAHEPTPTEPAKQSESHRSDPASNPAVLEAINELANVWTAQVKRLKAAP